MNIKTKYVKKNEEKQKPTFLHFDKNCSISSENSETEENEILHIKQRNYTFQEKWNKIGESLKEKYGENNNTYRYTSIETANRRFQDAEITYRN
jgi:hypothetical protein